MMKVTGIILAGGQSLRMGREKGLTPFLGKPMIKHVIESLKPLCEEIILSTNTNKYDFIGFPTVKDRLKDTGPSAGIIEGLSTSQTNTNIIISCDLPLVSSYFLKRLLTLSKSYEVTVPVLNDRLQPLCGIYKKNIISQMEKLILEGEKRMTCLLDHFNTYFVTNDDLPEFDFDQLLKNFNTRQEINSYIISNQVT